LERGGFVNARRARRRFNKVLIVSADDDLGLLLQFLLETDGFQVALSKAPDLALQTLIRDAPDAIFFDVLFPGGFSLLEFIQKISRAVSIFTVVRRPEFGSMADRSPGTAIQGSLLTPIDYQGVKALLGGKLKGRSTGVGPSLHRRSSAVVEAI
jgi:DNA-binding NtrC family response regulator